MICFIGIIDIVLPIQNSAPDFSPGHLSFTTPISELLPVFN
jgi:hypothetical protein